MNAFVAMQLESAVVFLLVLASFIFRFLLKQYSLNVHYKLLYEKQLHWQIERLTKQEATPVMAQPLTHYPVATTTDIIATA